MDITITKNIKQPLLSRHAIEAVVTYSGATPRREEFVRDIGAKIKVAPELVVVQKIAVQFGETKAIVSAVAYDSQEKMTAILPKVKKKEAKDAQKPAEGAS